MFAFICFLGRKGKERLEDSSEILNNSEAYELRFETC